MLRIGVDVGGTNTDAALLRDLDVLATRKQPTTAQASDGVVAAVRAVLDGVGVDRRDVDAVMIGTTHFLNALVEGRELSRTGVLRLCGAATRALPPMCDWPDHLRELTDGGSFMVGGGVHHDGTLLAPINPDEIIGACHEWKRRGTRSVAICSVFAHVDSSIEDAAAAIVASTLPDASISLSHRIGRSGLLARENATILNASLRDLAKRTICDFRKAFSEIGLNCPIYLTQNDGTVMAADYAEKFPVFAIASGPTNSMRGAAFLTGKRNAAVVDVGGTTTDVGILKDGFPRSRSEGALIAGVQTNFFVPDVESIALGGGSVVTLGDTISIGPKSVGYQLPQKARCFGGDTLTATDIAVAAGRFSLGSADNLTGLDPAHVDAALQQMQGMVEGVVDRMKPNAEPIDVILVGGGSTVIPAPREGVASAIQPEHFGSANAVGAAIAQVGGDVDMIYSLAEKTRPEVLRDAEDEARRRAVEAGADAPTLELVSVEETPLSYLPGNALRLSIRVVGDIRP